MKFDKKTIISTDIECRDLNRVYFYIYLWSYNLSKDFILNAFENMDRIYPMDNMIKDTTDTPKSVS